MKKWALLGVSLLVAGCNQTARAPDHPHMYGTEVRSFILANKRSIFIDPDSVRDVSISDPYSTPRGLTTVCLRLNARNRMGGYTGMTDMLIFFKRDGRYETHTVTDPNDRCNRPLQPFPELG